MADKLDGYRGHLPGALQQVMKKTDDDRAEKGDTLRQYILGVAAGKLMAGVASKDEVSRVMAEMVLRCEAIIRENYSKLLVLPDLTSQEAVALHFEARVAGGIITMLNEMVHAGRTAIEIMEQDRPDS